MILPFLFVSLLLTLLILPIILSSLFSIPGQIIRFLFTPNTQTSNNMMASQPAMGSSITSNTLPSRPTAMSPSTSVTPRPTGNIPVAGPAGSNNQPSGNNLPTNQPVIPTVISRHLGHLRSNKNCTLSTKSNTLHLPYGWHFKSLKVSYPIMEFFWKVMDSENCIERIACRMAVAEAAGTMPIWINW